MTSQTVTDMREFEAALDGPVIHDYPKDPRYRLSRHPTLPQVGDIARCGHVKTAPPTGKYLGGPITCEGCRTLWGLS